MKQSTRDEILRGKALSMKSMALSLAQGIVFEHLFKDVHTEIEGDGFDFREWVVVLQFPTGEILRDNFMEFPSPALMATVILLKG